METLEALQKLGTAAALGLLVGMQRERAGSALAGIRTFTLMTVFGALAALLVPALGGWVVAAGLLGLAAMLVVGNVVVQRDGASGITTEIAALLMYCLGAYVVLGNPTAAVVVAGAAALLLHLKERMHGFVRALTPEDLRAVMTFVLISLVILPVLPDQGFGPYGVLNPREIWWMVVLIVGIGLAGYVAFKIFGARAGTALGGLLGGLASSTATTMSYARQARGTPDVARFAALAIVLANAVMGVRVIVEVAVVARGSFAAMIWPLASLVALQGALGFVLWLGLRRQHGSPPEPSNPAELRSALVFAGIYALVKLAVAWSNERFGYGALYGVAVISGLTDVDAITLSVSRLVEQGNVQVAQGWRAIVAAVVANIAFKGAMAAAIGGRALALRVIPVFAVICVAGLLLILLWP